MAWNDADKASRCDKGNTEDNGHRRQNTDTDYIRDTSYEARPGRNWSSHQLEHLRGRAGTKNTPQSELDVQQAALGNTCK